MSENTSMIPEVISVKLQTFEGKDVLFFDIVDELHESGMMINLNSEDGRQDLVELFSILLKKMTQAKIVLEFKVEDGYSKGLFKDVASEYVAALSKEINNVYTEMETIM